MANFTSTPTSDEIVKPMERGQITIPIAIRRKLNITPKTWLWIKLVEDKILIESVEKESSAPSLADYLLSAASDSEVYWTKDDTKSSKKVARKTKERLKRLVG